MPFLGTSRSTRKKIACPVVGKTVVDTFGGVAVSFPLGQPKIASSASERNSYRVVELILQEERWNYFRSSHLVSG